MENNTRKPLGHIKHAIINITNPREMNFDMNYNALTLLVGTNGSGKSLLLKLTWITSFIMESILALKNHNVVQSQEELINFIQETYDNTFEDQNFHGDINFIFEDENNYINIKFNTGKVENLDINLTSDTEFTGFPIFMSTSTRAYDDIVKFLKLAKLVNYNMATGENLNKILEHYRLYDVFFISKIVSKCSILPYMFDEDLQDKLKNSFKLSVDVCGISIDLENNIIYYLDKDNVKHNILTLSKGEQSLVNMLSASNM